MNFSYYVYINDMHVNMNTKTQRVSEQITYLSNFRKYLIVVCDFRETFDSTYGFITIPQNKILKAN